VAPFFKDRELVILSTCAPSASPDVNWRFVRGRGIVIACPKLDRTEGYVEKLTDILKSNGIPKVIIVRMEVPCCGGLSMIVKEAAQKSGRTDLIVEEACRVEWRFERNNSNEVREWWSMGVLDAIGFF